MGNKNIMALFLATLLAGLSLLTACSQSKQTRSITPYFDGVLSNNDSPVKHAKIMLSTVADDTLCQKAKVFSSTNRQGQFSLKAITEEYAYTPFVNYQLDEWHLCALYNKNIYLLHNNNRYASGSVTGSIFLECDLASSQPICHIRH